MMTPRTYRVESFLEDFAAMEHVGVRGCLEATVVRAKEYFEEKYPVDVANDWLLTFIHMCMYVAENRDAIERAEWAVGQGDVSSIFHAFLQGVHEAWFTMTEAEKAAHQPALRRVMDIAERRQREQENEP